MDGLLRAIDAVIANDIALVFAIFIIIVFVVSLGYRAKGSSERSAGIDRSAPMMLTTLGVLGTFVGIFWGLLEFDVSDIDASVPRLLEGLKIAFSTSIVGMGTAVLYKFTQHIFPRTVEASEVSPEDIYRVLTEIRDDSRSHAEAQQTAVADVRKAISGEDDSSLVTQMQKLRTTVMDGNKELKETIQDRLDKQIEEFQKFAETMAENNSKALIEALEQVIRDFNTKLSEQFGENFKQLNEAVGALLGWQDQYKEHVERLEENFQLAVQAIQTSEQALKEISEHTAKIPEQMEALESLMVGLQQQTTNLEAHLEAIAGLRDKAVEAFPVIEENLNKLTNELTSQVETLVSEVRQTLGPVDNYLAAMIAATRFRLAA